MKYSRSWVGWWRAIDDGDLVGLVVLAPRVAAIWVVWRAWMVLGHAPRAADQDALAG
jgi:hypothetical protein